MRDRGAIVMIIASPQRASLPRHGHYNRGSRPRTMRTRRAETWNRHGAPATMNTERSTRPSSCRWSDTIRSRRGWLATLLGLAIGFTSSLAVGAETSQRWRVSHGEDRITRMKAWLATSPTVRAEDRMGNPLEKTEGWLGFYCHEGTEGVFIGFLRAPTLPLGEGVSPDEQWPVRTRWDEEVRSMTLRPNAADHVLEFADPGSAALPLNGTDSALVELPWQGPEVVYFAFPIADARNAIRSARDECGGSSDGGDDTAHADAAQLALSIALARDREARAELLAGERLALFATALEEYIGAIRSSVTRNWRRPTGVPAGLKCTVSVVQANDGKVLRVAITQSSGNAAFDRSVEQAVLAASPLPAPRQRALFDREIVFLFSPRS